MINAILPINLNSYNNKYVKKYKTPQPFVTKLQKDTVSFTANPISLLQKNSHDITTSVLETISHSENLLGKGREGEVYKIPQTDFCVKLLKFRPALRRNFGRWNFSVSDENKINHVVASAENGATLMQYIQGHSLQFDKPTDLYNLPLSSYRELVSQVENAYDYAMVFDSAPSNVIYNKDKNELIAIDFFNPHQDISCDNYSFSKIFSALEAEDYHENPNELNKKLLGKLTTIITDEISSSKQHEFDIEEKDVKRMLRIFEETQSTLEPQYFLMKDAIFKLFELQKLQRRGEDVTNSMNGAAKYINCIIRQILT